MVYSSKISQNPEKKLKSNGKLKNIFEKMKFLAQNVVCIKNYSNNELKSGKIVQNLNTQSAILNYLILSGSKQRNYELQLIDKNSPFLKSAQKLRFNSFFGDQFRKKKFDKDIYDRFSEHLVVLDNSKFRKKVIGTYRLLTQEMMPSCYDFYTSSEFDISKLKKKSKNILEVGRSCVDESYRDGRIIKLLWRGLAREIMLRNPELVMGCASFPTIDSNQIIEELSYLQHFHHPPKSFDTLPIKSKALKFKVLKKSDLNPKTIFQRLPPLIKAYIRTGAWFGTGCVVDNEFNTIDVCVILKTQNIKNKYLDLGKRK